MFDIAIIGAGPAGATLARQLGSQYRVLLVDRRRLDLPPAESPVQKLCGGLLAPAAQRELARQGLGIPQSVIAGPQLFAVRTLDLAANLERLYQRFYVNTDREAFDRWLVSLVPERVERCWGWSLSAIDEDEHAPTLTFRTAEGGRASVRARLVVGADGAGSTVRRLVYRGESAPERYAAIQAVFDAGTSDPFYGAIFDESLTDFYGWTVPKGGTVAVGAAFPTGPGVSDRFDSLVVKLRASGFRFGRELSRAAAPISRPTRAGHLFVGRGRVLLAGEAAGFISPSSAEGISYALRSGANLGSALESGIEGAGARYVSASWPLALKVGAKAAKGGVIYGAGVRRLVMRAGIGALPDRDTRSPQVDLGWLR